MSKALELIRLLIKGANEYEKETGNKNPTVYLSRNNLLVIEKSLHRLESIDNAEPSEALECLEELRSNLGVIYNNTLDNIEQALLKAETPKKYLKWEDLEFEKKQQVMDVLLNGKPYILYFYKLSTQSEVNIFAIDMHIVTLNSHYPEDVQFFNDLHLERVEE